VPLHFEGCAAGGVELGGEGVEHQPGGWGPVTLVQGVRARVGSNLNTERGVGVGAGDFLGAKCDRNACRLFAVDRLAEHLVM
jgi:hypothetical protein